MTQANNFLKLLDTYYRNHARSMPWREPEADGSFDIYKIVVSEIMLQQTQVSRVIPKYWEFLQTFPTMQSLAAAGLPEVLAVWSGLGYNRRAKYLHETAKILANKVGPSAYEELVACPGIGPNTAAAVLAYSLDKPVLFLETNIKTVLIHHFYKGQRGISDKALLQKLAEIVPWNNGSAMPPRAFYWAMMDYGTYLKTTVGNLNNQSKSYTKQSKFHGSKREIRGKVIKSLLKGPATFPELQKQITDSRLEEIIANLEQENLVRLQGKTLMLYNESIKP